jgi:aspartate/methionine/tyrosine aminotransferase
MDEIEIANDMYLNASSVSQHLAPFVFAEGGEFRMAMTSEIERRRDALIAGLADCPGGRLIRPEAGIHALFRLDGGDDEEIAVGLVEEQGVFVHPGYLYGIEDEPHLVLSCLPPATRIEEGCERIRAHLSRLFHSPQEGRALL